MSDVPTHVRQRLEKLGWSTSRIEGWWTKRLVGFYDRAPCALADWQLDELLQKHEDADRISNARDQ